MIVVGHQDATILTILLEVQTGQPRHTAKSLGGSWKMDIWLCNQQDRFYSKRSFHCGDFIESQYCNPTRGLKVRRIETTDRCTISYSDTHIVTTEDICHCRDMKGKNPIVVCHHYFDSNNDIPSSGRSTNFSQMSHQEKAKKKK